MADYKSVEELRKAAKRKRQLKKKLKDPNWKVGKKKDVESFSKGASSGGPSWAEMYANAKSSLGIEEKKKKKEK